MPVRNSLLEKLAKEANEEAAPAPEPVQPEPVKVKRAKKVTLAKPAAQSPPRPPTPVAEPEKEVEAPVQKVEPDVSAPAVVHVEDMSTTRPVTLNFAGPFTVNIHLHLK